MRPVTLPSQNRIKELLDYDPETGFFTWKPGQRERRKASVRYVGKVAGLTKTDGYIAIKIDGHLIAAHRLAWVYVNGDVLLPDQEMDHINGVKPDNRIANLRPATKSENMANMKGHSKRGLPKGVAVQSSNGRFMAAIMVNREKLYLGTFDTPEEAHAAYCSAAKAHRGEFARPA